MLAKMLHRNFSSVVQKKAAFIGLGNMGLPMALNLHKSGFAVHGFDLNPASVAAAKEVVSIIYYLFLNQNHIIGYYSRCKRC